MEKNAVGPLGPCQGRLRFIPAKQVGAALPDAGSSA
jgi:hypothetical protein